jgi:hypothetical protein
MHQLIGKRTPDKMPAAVLTVEHSDWSQDPAQAATNSDPVHSSSDTSGLSEHAASVLPARLPGSHTAFGHLWPTAQHKGTKGYLTIEILYLRSNVRYSKKEKLQAQNNPNSLQTFAVSK